MSEWKLKEFKKLCLDSGFEKIWSHTISLAFKYRAAVYHKIKIQQKIDEISSQTFLEKAPNYDLEIAFELDALMNTLNSVWDFLGQLLNECFIHPKANSAKIYFNDIYIKIT
jgi:hypothetical protein